MFEANKGYRFTARDLYVETRIIGCFNSALENTSNLATARDANFQLLKNRGFTFDARAFDADGKFKGDNYGNYDLAQITLDDFMPLAGISLPDRIREYLESFFVKQFGAVDGEKERYIQAIVSAVNFFVVDSTDVVELNTDMLDGSTKKHEFYTLWEHFKTFIVFSNQQRASDFVYIEIGFD